MEVVNHYLKGNDIQFIQTPNVGSPFASGLPDTIIIHFTAGSSAESSIKTLTDPASKASAHLVVGRNGSITQLAPFNVLTWHAGESAYGSRIGFNKYAIGIEIDNAGPLTKRADGFYSWFGRKYEEKDTVYAIHRNQAVARYWHAYTEQQINLVFDLCMLLKKVYNIKFILGHEEISPKRKEDPGPAFPLDKLREKVLNTARDSEQDESNIVKKEGEVIASKLNIRSLPQDGADKVAMPLAQGAKLKIIESKDGWYKVQTIIEGWVSSKYVK
jgi:N-acetylmuramoyl-L-alanine amidase